MALLSINFQASQSKLKGPLAEGLLIFFTLLGCAGFTFNAAAGTIVRIRGEVIKHPTLGEAKQSAAVFVIARRKDSKMPLAVQRLPLGKFPISFDLGPEHVMVPGQKLEGEVFVEAKLTQRGDAVSKSGDWVMSEAPLRLDLKKKTEKLSLQLKKVLTGN